MPASHDGSMQQCQVKGPTKDTTRPSPARPSHGVIPVCRSETSGVAGVREAAALSA